VIASFTKKVKTLGLKTCGNKLVIYRVAQNKILPQTIFNISATSGLILKILVAV